MTRKHKKTIALKKNAESAAPLHVSPHVSLHSPLRAHVHAPVDARLHVLRNVFRQRRAEKARERENFARTSVASQRNFPQEVLELRQKFQNFAAAGITGNGRERQGMTGNDRG